MLKHRYSRLESLKIMGSASKQLMGPDIELLLWNVFKCKKEGWRKDFINLIGDKDLVLLQEAILNSPFDMLFNSSLQHEWIMARSFRNLQTNIETGVKTGSSVAAAKQYFSASAHGEPFTNTKKMLLATEYPLACFEGSTVEIEEIGNKAFKKNELDKTDFEISSFESSLLVVNTHIINFVSFEKFRAHLNQVFQTMQHHEGPILLAGDFNTWNGKRLRYFSELARSLALEEVEMVRQPRLNHLFKHLDHIYCRGLEVVNVQVHSNIQSSDHYPISLSLRTLELKN